MRAEALHVEFGGWGLMTVWNRGFISSGLCSGMRYPYRGIQPTKLYVPVTVHREQSVKKEYQQDATI